MGEAIAGALIGFILVGVIFANPICIILAAIIMLCLAFVKE